MHSPLTALRGSGAGPSVSEPGGDKLYPTCALKSFCNRQHHTSGLEDSSLKPGDLREPFLLLHKPIQGASFPLFTDLCREQSRGPSPCPPEIAVRSAALDFCLCTVQSGTSNGDQDRSVNSSPPAPHGAPTSLLSSKLLSFLAPLHLRRMCRGGVA